MFFKRILRSVPVIKEITRRSNGVFGSSHSFMAIMGVQCQYSTQNPSEVKIETSPEVKQPASDNISKLNEQINERLMEFFDHKDNWGLERVRVGRAWKKEELRIKSSSDLHKLWYILLKEKNMLFTMEHESKSQNRLFPNPDRIDKILESMFNLEEVVRERNQAYHLLETGENGERPGLYVYNKLGMRSFYKMFEHFVPKELNEKFKNHVFYYSFKETKNFIKLLREKIWVKKRRSKLQDKRYILQLMKRFPHVDDGYLKELYPEQDINKLRQSRKTATHLQQRVNG